MKKLLFGSFLAMGGCVLTKEAFVDQSAQIACERENVCRTEANLTDFLLACDEAVTNTADVLGIEASCSYDAGAGAKCLEDLEVAGCTEQGRLDYPVSCADVCLANDTDEGR